MLERRPRGLGGRLRRVGRDDAGAHVDRQALVRARDPELEHLGAEVVEVAAEPRLGVDPHVELVDSAASSVVAGRTRSALRLSVTGAVVAVLGEVADGEVHRQACSDGGAAAAPRRSSGRRCRVDPRQLLAHRSRRSRAGRRVVGERTRRGSRGRPPGGSGAAPARSCAGSSSALSSASWTRVDRRRDRVRVGALEEQEARDRPGVRAARAPRAGRPGSRRRPAAARAPGRRAAGSLVVGAGGQRHAQHAQDHVGRLDAAARVEERVRLVAQHRAVADAPEQRRSAP